MNSSEDIIEYKDCKITTVYEPVSGIYYCSISMNSPFKNLK